MFLLYGVLIAIIPITVVVGVVYFIVRSIKGNSSGDTGDSLTFKEVAIDTGLFLFLVTSIASLISIIFSAIDKKFVDVLSIDNYYGSASVINDDVRLAVSIILVAFPIYLTLAFYKSRNLISNPARQKLEATKYVNYFTVGVSALFIVGSLVSTIYQYLGGALGPAFAYKILTVTIISLALFIYNYYTLKRNYSTKSYMSQLFAAISLVAVVTAVVYSVNILGSPAQVRKIKFDEKKLSDLSTIQQQILENWQRNKVLPSNLDTLAGDGFTYGFVLPKDPSTKESYEYKIATNSEMVKAVGQPCVIFYPGKFGNYPIPMDIGSPKDASDIYPGTSYDVSKITCMLPTKAVFELCANFESVRAYDENGVDQSGAGWATSNSLGVKSLDISSARYYEPQYYDSYNKNPNWNHDAKYTCFKRTIDPMKYPSYN